jgi:hypothetical protein
VGGGAVVCRPSEYQWVKVSFSIAVMKCYFQWKEKDNGETETIDIYPRQKTINT